MKSVRGLLLEEPSLFDLPWRFDDECWTVKVIDESTAGPHICRYHYSGSTPGSAIYFGCYAPDLVCVVAVSLGANQYGVKGRYHLQEWPGNLEITRVAAHPDAPRNTPSRAVSLALRTIHQNGFLYGDDHREYPDWVFSYADTGQGHHGGIYQALNAVYVGMSKPLRGFVIDGRNVHPRSIYSRYGTNRADEVRRLVEAEGKTFKIVEGINTAKHLYILLCGGPGTNRRIRRHLDRWALPYPKREVPDETVPEIAS